MVRDLSGSGCRHLWARHRSNAQGQPARSVDARVTARAPGWALRRAVIASVARKILNPHQSRPFQRTNEV